MNILNFTNINDNTDSCKPKTIVWRTQMNIYNAFKVAMVKEAITEVFEKFFKRRAEYQVDERKNERN